MLQIIIIILTLAADQLSKFILTPMLDALPGDTIPVIQDVFHLTFVRNEGASFGMLQGFRVFFIVITFVVLIAATWFMIKYRQRHSKFLKVALALAFSGALGNLIDRIAFGYVRDLFDFRIINFWVFNVADTCLVVGAIMLGIYILFIHKDKEKRPDNVPLTEEDIPKDADEKE